MPTGMRPDDCAYARVSWICQHKREIILGITGIAIGMLAAPLAPAWLGAVGTGAFAGGLSSALTSATDQYTTTGTVDPWRTVKDTTIGAGLGALGGALTSRHLNGTIRSTPRGLPGGGGDDLTRVGRWMSPDEHAAMVKTGHVQVGSGGTTSVASPPNAQSYMAQARPGSHHVEFDVPTGSLRPGGAPGWSQIPSPENLMWGKLAPQRGYPVPQSPVSACNIVHVATKSPSC
jgi:hypothetical protein